jgi:hypothetical protein
MGRRRTAPIAKCSEPLPRKSTVTANGGIYGRGGRRYRRYLCAPPTGDPHHFSVQIFIETATQALPFVVP